MSYNHGVVRVSIVDAEWRQDRDVNKGGQPRHRKGVCVMELWGVEEYSEDAEEVCRERSAGM